MADRPGPPVSNVGTAINYIENVMLPRVEALATTTFLRRAQENVPYWGLFILYPCIAAVALGLLGFAVQGPALAFVAALGAAFLATLMNVATISEGQNDRYLYARSELKKLWRILAELQQIEAWNPGAEVGFRLEGNDDFDRLGVKARIRQLKREAHAAR